jgi:phospholipid/cholesterol/gamma-HCH transport system substrate-binding protein
MARKSNPKLIGGFVVGAIVLTLVGLLAFGGGEFLKHKAKVVMFFQGSLGGLDVGAPVTFRGVKVGTVTSIVIEYDVAKQALYIPVYLELEPEKFNIISGERNPARNMQAMIDRGLRGQLETLSFVTGQTSINFDFHPNTPVRLLNLKKGIQELPSIPSTMAQLQATLTGVLGKINALPLEDISAKLLDTIDSANQVMKDAQSAITDANGLVVDLNSQIKPLSASALSTSDQARLTLLEAQKRLQLREGEPMDNLNKTLLDSRVLIGNLNHGLPPLIAAAQQVMAKAGTALDQASATLRTAQSAIAPTSPLYYQLDLTLRELKGAATAIRVFAEYIQRNPNALLTGNH